MRPPRSIHTPHSHHGPGRRPSAKALLSAALVTFALVAGAAAALAGRGEERPPPLVSVLTDDVSDSFDSIAKECVDDQIQVATATALSRGELFGGVNDGAPLSRGWDIQRNFEAELPETLNGNAGLQNGWLRRRAQSLRPELEKLAQAVARHPGSPVLEGLERIALFRAQQFPKARFHVVLCTDLAVIGEGIDIRKPVEQWDVERTLDIYSKRLKGLTGARVFLIGVGKVERGYFPPDRLRAVISFVEKLLRRVDAQLVVADTDLGSAFPER